ncbi:MAG: ABC transporter substrate-binding protein [Cloacibacterium sp.]|nr:ABC transporter substrate-binding protein [Cloacibacterium sp.]
MKIVSLVPSITKTLFDLGVDENKIVGRTKFCIHPKEKVKNIAIVGGTKNLNIEKIKKLNPDLILSNKEENEKSQIEELMKHFKVYVSEVSTLEENDIFLQNIGKLLSKEKEAEEISLKIGSIFQSIPPIPVKKKAAYLIWRNPYMSVGNDTFIHHILEKTGFENIFKSQTRYPTISIENLEEAEYILLSSEPYPFKEKHFEELYKVLPNAQIKIVDGEAFSWFGSHLMHCKNYFDKLITLL